MSSFGNPASLDVLGGPESATLLADDAFASALRPRLTTHATLLARPPVFWRRFAFVAFWPRLPESPRRTMLRSEYKETTRYCHLFPVVVKQCVEKTIGMWGYKELADFAIRNETDMLNLLFSPTSTICK